MDESSLRQVISFLGSRAAEAQWHNVYLKRNLKDQVPCKNSTRLLVRPYSGLCFQSGVKHITQTSGPQFVS